MLIDLSHTFSHKMPVHPDEVPPVFEQSASVNGDGYNLEVLHTSLHVGTHVDAPYHFFDDGASVSDIDLKRFVGRGLLIDARGRKEVGLDLFEHRSIQSGDVVLVMTGFDEHFGTSRYYKEHPQFTESATRYLVDQKITMVGVDSPGPDHAPYPLHPILLKAGVLILENLTGLSQLIGVDEFRVMAFPAKFKASGAPVRVVAESAM